MFCPRCGYEYREGITTCPDCQVALVAELPPGVEQGGEEEARAIDVQPETEPVELCTVEDEVAGQMLQDMLADQGIYSFVQGAMSGLRGALAPGLLMGEVMHPLRVFVPRGKLREALEVLGDWQGVQRAGEPQAGPMSEPVELCTLPDAVTAQLLCDMLADQQIRSGMLGEGWELLGHPPPRPGGEALMVVYVPAASLAEAKQVLADFRRVQAEAYTAPSGDEGEDEEAE